MPSFNAAVGSMPAAAATIGFAPLASPAPIKDAGNPYVEGSFSFTNSDTGYGATFREIGARAGPFDLALVGIGAYTPRVIMESSHATPEEAIAIARDIRASRAVGMHWGSIMLTPEDPFEAPARFRQAALEQQYGEANAWIMQIGEVRSF